MQEAGANNTLHTGRRKLMTALFVDTELMDVSGVEDSNDSI